MWAILVVGSIRFVAWAVPAISTTPTHVCTTLQQYSSIGLLYEQTHSDEVLGLKVHLDRFWVVRLNILKLIKFNMPIGFLFYQPVDFGNSQHQSYNFFSRLPTMNFDVPPKKFQLS